jgi:hypothetical protein
MLPIHSEPGTRREIMWSSRHIRLVRVGVAVIGLALVTGSVSSPAAEGRSDASQDAAGIATPTAPTRDLKQTEVLKSYANLPVSFIENRGQIDARVRYYAQGPRYAFYFTRNEVLLSFTKQPVVEVAASTDPSTGSGSSRAKSRDEGGEAPHEQGATTEENLEIFEGGATQRVGMDRRPNGVPNAAAALGAPNAGATFTTGC